MAVDEPTGTRFRDADAQDRRGLDLEYTPPVISRSGSP
jgi:hypothetical protein